MTPRRAGHILLALGVGVLTGIAYGSLWACLLMAAFLGLLAYYAGRPAPALPAPESSPPALNACGHTDPPVPVEVGPDAEVVAWLCPYPCLADRSAPSIGQNPNPVVHYSASKPPPGDVGDMWIDADDGLVRRWNGAEWQTSSARPAGPRRGAEFEEIRDWNGRLVRTLRVDGAEPTPRVRELRAALAAKGGEIKCLTDSWRGDDGHFVVPSRQHEEYLSAVEDLAQIRELLSAEEEAHALQGEEFGESAKRVYSREHNGGESDPAE